MKKYFKDLKGLILATSIVIGTVIGTGIFFKNYSMISWAHGNGFVVIGAWIIGSIIAFSSAIAFSQIAKQTKKSNTGIGQLSEEMVGKTFGWHTKVNWAFYYFPWSVVLITLYSSDYIIKIIFPGHTASDHTLLTIMIALILMVIFLTINVLWVKIADVIQVGTTAIKIIPLIILALGAFVLVFILPEHNWWTNLPNPTTHYDPTLANDTKGMKPLLIIIFIVPGTLFAYDSFINATNVSETVSKKHVTYAIVGGMIFIACIYLLVTIAILSTGTLYAENAIVKLFGGNPNNATGIYSIIIKSIEFFILVSTLGGANGFSLAWTNTTRAILKKNTSKNVFISMLIGLFVIGFPLIIITLVVYFINYVPAPYHINHNSAGRHIGISVIDALSNPLIVISYTVYAITLLYAINRNIKQKNKEKKYAWWFNIAAFISSISILLILGYILFYSTIYKTLSSSTTTFGGLPGWTFLLIVVVYISLWFTLPFIVKKIMPNLIVDVNDEELIDIKSKKIQN